jgi:hypothetical protein
MYGGMCTGQFMVGVLQTINKMQSIGVQVYFVQIEGSSNVNDITLDFGDAMEIVDINKLHIKALKNSHFLFIEMAKV